MGKSCQGCLLWGSVAAVGVLLVGGLIFGGLALIGGSEMAGEFSATVEAEVAAEATSEAAVATDIDLGAEQTSAGGFAFAPSADWQVVAEGDAASGVGYVQLLPPGTSTESAEVQFLMFISPVAVLAQELPGGETSLEQIADYMANASQGTLPAGVELTLSDPYATTVGGENALAFDIEGSAGGQNARGRIVVALANNEQQYFALVMTGPERDWANGAIVDAVLSSVRFSTTN
jgi:hypothetical protein